MASRDLVNNLGKVLLNSPGNAAASPLTALKSSILDTQGFEAAMIAVSIGTLSGVTGSNFLTLVLQESDTTNDADFTNVSITQNQLNGTPSATADFGDQNRAFSNLYPTSLLPAPVASLPTLYTGFQIINSSTQANSHVSVGYIGYKRYIRLVGTWTGSPATVNLDVMGFLGHAQFEPVTSPAPITAT